MARLQHILKAQQFDIELLQDLFTMADIIEQKLLNKQIITDLKGKVINTLFYQPSTRTNNSFQVAAIRMGAQVVDTRDPQTFSSDVKGESFTDMIKTLNQYYDAIIIRHPKQGMIAKAAAVSNIPIINAGDGPGQHPTQALLDLYTLYKILDNINGLRIAMVGDLFHGRTVRSLSYLLSMYEDITIYYVSPPSTKMRDDVKQHLQAHNVKYEETDNLQEVLPKVMVVYETRVQAEYFEDKEDYQKANDKCILTPEIMPKGKYPYILHPLPRNKEIDPLLDADPRAQYFSQVYNGMLIRMALLQMLLT